MSWVVDGVDMEATVGLVLTRIPDLYDAASADYPVAHVPGRTGAVHLSKLGGGQHRERRINLYGAIAIAKSAATPHMDVINALHTLKRRILRRQVEMYSTSDPSIAWDVIVEVPRVPFIEPHETQRMTEVQWTFLLVDPAAHDAAATVVDFTSGPTSCPLGSLPSAPQIDLTGPFSNPIINYLDVSSGLIHSLECTVTGGAGELLTIECEAGRISLNGIVDNDILTGGDFIFLDPVDTAVGTHPQLSLTGSAASALATYRRKWG